MKDLLTEFAQDVRDNPDVDIDMLVKTYIIVMNIKRKEIKERNIIKLKKLTVCLYVAIAIVFIIYLIIRG